MPPVNRTRFFLLLLLLFAQLRCVPQLQRPRGDTVTPAWDRGSGDTAPDTRAGTDSRASESRLRADERPAAPDQDLGRWYQVDKLDCTSYCKTQGRITAASVEGTSCMSGEVRPASGVAAGIKFLYGCWPADCHPEPNPGASSSWNIKYCYRPGQNHDNDNTDLTVGCFCR